MKFLLGNKIVSIFIFLSVGFVFLLSVYSPKPQLTYDSHAYIEASQNIDSYFSGANADGHSYLFRPPIIPIYLHFFADKILAAKVLNVVCFVLSLWLCYFIGREFKFEPIYLSLFVVSVGTSYPWVQNHLFIWSEPLFNVLLLFLVWMIVAKNSWIGVIFLCVLLYFVRKAGVIISAGIVCAYFLQKEYKKAAILSVITFTTALCWEWGSALHSAGDTVQVIFADNQAESRLNYMDVVTAWFVPRNVPIAARIFLLGACIAVMVYLFKQNLIQITKITEVKMVFAVMVIYIFVFAVMWRLDYNEAERYLSVMIPLAMLLVIVVLRAFCSGQKSIGYFLVFFILWMTYPVGRTLYHLLQ